MSHCELVVMLYLRYMPLLSCFDIIFMVHFALKPLFFPSKDQFSGFNFKTCLICGLVVLTSLYALKDSDYIC